MSERLDSSFLDDALKYAFRYNTFGSYSLVAIAL